MTIPQADPHERIRRFVIETGEAIAPPGTHRIATAEDAAGNPVAEAVMAVSGVQEVVLEENTVMALRREDASWDELEDRVRYAIGTALRPADPSSEATGPALPDDEMFAAAAEMLQRDINPSVASHGGQIELIDVQDGVVVVRLMGGCQGCGMATVTLRQGVEAHFRRTLPGFQGIRDVTDHASGANPYFR